MEIKNNHIYLTPKGEHTQTLIFVDNSLKIYLDARAR